MFGTTDPELRDLEWVMSSPGLLEPGPRVVSDAWCREALKRGTAALEQVARHPSVLHQHVLNECRSQRLGVYFEALVHFWLAQVLGYQGVQKNVPLRQNGQTVGEFDFLFREAGRQGLFHWETAVKFYLFLPKAGLFHGPNGKDRLDLKLKRMFDHQLRLSEQAGLESVTALAFVKGMLFYPLDTGWRTAAPEFGISEDHARGWWTRSAGDAVDAAGADSRFVVLKRREWLAPAVRPEGLAADELLALVEGHFRQAQGSLMVAQVKARADGLLTEQSRGVIVHEAWPFR